MEVRHLDKLPHKFIDAELRDLTGSFNPFVIGFARPDRHCNGCPADELIWLKCIDRDTIRTQLKRTRESPASSSVISSRLNEASSRDTGSSALMGNRNFHSYRPFLPSDVQMFTVWVIVPVIRYTSRPAPWNRCADGIDYCERTKLEVNSSGVSDAERHNVRITAVDRPQNPNPASRSRLVACLAP